MAQWTGKLVGGLLGLPLGPVGVLIGLYLGHQYDVKSEPRLQGPDLSGGAGAGIDAAATAERFFRTTFRVMGHVAKSDGRVSEQEIAAARAVMGDLRLTPAQVRMAISHFSAGKANGFDLLGDLHSLRQACAGRPDLVRVFLEIQMRAAIAGNNLDGPVRSIMQRVASQLGISTLETARIEAILRIQRGSFRREPSKPSTAVQLDQAYRVLEITADATNDEVVKSYRRQLSRHHPDKLKANGLPESMIEHAKQRTQQIIEAYELIKEKRGI